MDLLDMEKQKLFTKYKFKCQYCGTISTKLLWLLKIKLIFTDKIYYTCPNCHKTNCFVSIFHLRHDSTDSIEKNRNKGKLWDDRYG